MARTKMSEPTYRDLDIYRLVVARMWKQKRVAEGFCVAPSRISQVVRRVRQWVDRLVGDWYFPDQPDLRFYAALVKADIRLMEYDDPHRAEIQDASGGHTYRRHYPTILDGHATPTVEPAALEPTPGGRESIAGGDFPIGQPVSANDSRSRAIPQPISAKDPRPLLAALAGKTPADDPAALARLLVLRLAALKFALKKGSGAKDIAHVTAIDMSLDRQPQVQQAPGVAHDPRGEPRAKEGAKR